MVLGLALFCPIGERSRNVPGHEVVRQDPDAYDEVEPAQRAGFDDYFVVRTPATGRRYRDHVVPGTTLVDKAALARIVAGWTVDVGSGTFSAPTLIVAGRRDSTVGYADATELLQHYPHATLTVIENAGHALMHERPYYSPRSSRTGSNGHAQATSDHLAAPHQALLVEQRPAGRPGADQPIVPLASEGSA